MFTGIIETTGKVVKKIQQGSNARLTIKSNITEELKIDQSVSHNGVCLTVVAIDGKFYELDVVKETIDKTNIGDLIVGELVNLERSVSANRLLDGHIVQGHVDEVANCIAVLENEGSWKFTFELNSTNRHLVVQKGSVCINGVSLTIAQLQKNSFSVAIIPYTYENTSFKQLQVGNKVNVEYDIVGKYLARFKQTGYFS